MTLYSKPVWLVITYNKSDRKEYERRVAAYDLPELLAFFNGEALRTIIKIEKLSISVDFLV